MKKTRNSFFTEANQTTQYNPNMMMGPAPYQASTAYNSFYAGPNPMMQQQGLMPESDIENRLAKIERQINRLDHRISKLESQTNTVIDDYDTNTTNMYML